MNQVLTNTGVRLCDNIRQNMAGLAKIYKGRLLDIAKEYAQLTPHYLKQQVYQDLDLIAQGLESGDISPWLASLEERFEAVGASEDGGGAQVQVVMLDALEDTLFSQLGVDDRPLVEAMRAGRNHLVAFMARRLQALEERESNLEEQHIFLRQVIDTNPNFVFVRDREGRFVLANKAVAESYGATVKELVGKTDADFLAKIGEELKAVEHLRRDDLRVMESGEEMFIFEQAITDAAGNERWLQTVKRPLMDKDGVIRYILGVSSDITERKRLEQMVQKSLERRAQQVQTSTEVAQEIAAATELDELFRRVVTLIKERFGYYHAQIFRYDPDIDAMVLVVGYGETGKQMLAANHRLESGRGVVGTAAVTRRPVLATDVTQDPDWVPNRFLPETAGELAVPIIFHHPDGTEDVMGLLDVQRETPGALTEEDQILLEGLCGQIASAIYATRLQQQLEERLRELNAC